MPRKSKQDDDAPESEAGPADDAKGDEGAAAAGDEGAAAGDGAGKAGAAAASGDGEGQGEGSEDGSVEDVDESDEESSSEESSSESDAEPVKLPSETLISGRQPRRTAGKRMAALLDEEEDDTFYKEKYGEEVFRDSNSDFDVEEEESWDELDTDFDEDEEAEEEKEGDVSEPDEELKRKRSVYTDPLKPAKKRRTGSTATGRRKGPPTAPGAKRAKRLAMLAEPRIERKSTRTVALKKTAELEAKQKKAAAKKPIEKKPRPPEKKMTQAERLREAVHTERVNAQSLMRFEQREAEKKKKQLRKTTFSGPVIRYVSQTEIGPDGAKQTRNHLHFISCDTFLGSIPFASDDQPPLAVVAAPVAAVP